MSEKSASCPNQDKSVSAEHACRARRRTFFPILSAECADKAKVAQLIVTERLFEGVVEQGLCTVSVHDPDATSPPSEALIWPAAKSQK
jgi:hypothetical protein